MARHQTNRDRQRSNPGIQTRNRQKSHHKKRQNKLVNLLKFFLEIVLLLLFAAALFLAYKYARMPREKIKRGEIRSGTTLTVSDQNRMNGFRTLPVFLVNPQSERLEDVLVIASIEKKNGNVRFASIDSGEWLKSGDGYDYDCSEAYDVGGAKNLLSLLNDNLRLDMEDYLIIRSCFVQETVDRFNGLTITVSEEELKSVNETLRILVKEPIPAAGAQKLNGEQVMAYLRSPYTQKNTMDKLAEISEMLLVRAEREKLSGINTVTDELLYHTTTSLSWFDFLQMVRELIVYEIKPHAVMPKGITEHPDELHEYLYPIS